MYCGWWVNVTSVPATINSKLTSTPVRSVMLIQASAWVRCEFGAASESRADLLGRESGMSDHSSIEHLQGDHQKDDHKE